MGDSLLGHLGNARGRCVGMRMVEGVEHDVCSGLGATFVHVVGKVVEMEEVGEKVVADAQLRAAGLRVTHGRKESRL